MQQAARLHNIGITRVFTFPVSLLKSEAANASVYLSIASVINPIEIIIMRSDETR